MELSDDARYLALTTRDARFDGRFFTGMKTTGIYCRRDLSGADAAAQNRRVLRHGGCGAERGISTLPSLPARGVA